MADLRNDEALVAGLHRHQPAGKLLVCGWWLVAGGWWLVAGGWAQAQGNNDEGSCRGGKLLLRTCAGAGAGAGADQFGDIPVPHLGTVTASYHAGLSP